MKLSAPKYYADFKCIADRCRHSCCIGWEIDVDPVSQRKYASLKGGYSEAIIKSISSDGAPHFMLSADGKCPHLDECGLCRIITEYGEQLLSDICREHPRFYNLTPHGKEMGIGMSCEEAARLILSSDGYRELITVGECEDEPLPDSAHFDSLSLREELFEILSNRAVPYENRIRKIAARLDLTYPPISRDAWHSLLPSLEFLDEEHGELFASYDSNATAPSEVELTLERALAYFIYRHCSPTTEMENFRLSLGFSLFAERLLASIASSAACRTQDRLTDIARIISEELEYSEDNTDSIKLEIAFQN